MIALRKVKSSFSKGKRFMLKRRALKRNNCGGWESWRAFAGLNRGKTSDPIASQIH
jgi:hypothetical protein